MPRIHVSDLLRMVSGVPLYGGLQSCMPWERSQLSALFSALSGLYDDPCMPTILCCPGCPAKVALVVRAGRCRILQGTTGPADEYLDIRNGARSVLLACVATACPAVTFASCLLRPYPSSDASEQREPGRAPHAVRHLRPGASSYLRFQEAPRGFRLARGSPW